MFALETMTAVGFLFLGVAFLTLGMTTFGMGSPAEAGAVFKIVGVLVSIIGFAILATDPVNPLFISIGSMMTILAFMWLIIGIIKLGKPGVALEFKRGFGVRDIITIDKHSLMMLGNMNIFGGLIMFIFAEIFIFAALRGIINPIGAAWLTISCMSWACAFWAITLVAYGKTKFSTVGWLTTAQAFYTLWIPAIMLLTGYLRFIV